MEIAVHQNLYLSAARTQNYTNHVEYYNQDIEFENMDITNMGRTGQV